VRPGATVLKERSGGADESTSDGVSDSGGNPLPLRAHNKQTRLNKRVETAWERALGLAPGEQCAESFVAYFEPAEVEGEFAEAYGLRDRGELVNAVLTDRGRLVFRMPDAVSHPIAFDSKRPAVVQIIGPTERRLSGSRGGAERTHLVEVSSRGAACVRIIAPESCVDALVRWGADRTEPTVRVSA
jgi:hypothetical protein